MKARCSSLLLLVSGFNYLVEADLEVTKVSLQRSSARASIASGLHGLWVFQHMKDGGGRHITAVSILGVKAA